MKSITLGLALSLLGGAALGSAALTGAALAQTPPASPPALKQPAAGPTPMPPTSQPNMQPTPPAPQGQQNGQPAIPTPGGPPEGMIVETPNGFYLVRPGDPNPQRLDLGRDGGQPGMGQGGHGRMGMGQPGMDRPVMGQNGPAAMPDGDDSMGDMADDGLQPPPPPHPHRPPPRPPEGKGARFRISTPNLTLGMKCPDDEPIKACVDAVSQLMDKVGSQGH